MDLATFRLGMWILLLLALCFNCFAEESTYYDFSEAIPDDVPHRLDFSFLKTKGTFGGWIQLDKNVFIDTPRPVRLPPVRRLRLYATTTSRDFLTLMFMVQGDQDRWGYHYIYADFLKPTYLRFRVGLFKKPFGLEALYSSRYFWMVNRSLGSINYLRLRDIGAVAYGYLFNNTFEYGAGVFNGNEDNLKNNPHKITCARIVLIPWNNTEGHLKRLKIGSSFATSQKYYTLSSFSTGSGTSFLSWNSINTRSRSDKMLLGGDVEWLYGPYALRGEFICVNWGKVIGPAASAPFSGYSWYIEAGYLYTAETQPGNNPLYPFNNFSFCRGGGALEFLARYEAFQADKRVIKNRLAQGSSYVSSFTLATNYYLNPYVLTRVDWQLSDFHSSINVKNRSVRYESVLTFRLQGEF